MPWAQIFHSALRLKLRPNTWPEELSTCQTLSHLSIPHLPNADSQVQEAGYYHQLPGSTTGICPARFSCRSLENCMHETSNMHMQKAKEARKICTISWNSWRTGFRIMQEIIKKKRKIEITGSATRSGLGYLRSPEVWGADPCEMVCGHDFVLLLSVLFTH